MADLNSTIVRGNLRVTEEIIGPLNIANLSTGANGQFLSISNNVPTWVNNPNTWRPLGTGANDAAAGNHSHSKSEIGLGNVDNTADANKRVDYANSAGSVAWGNVSDKPITITQRNNDSPVSGAYAWGTHVTMRNTDNWFEIYAPHVGTSSSRVYMQTGWDNDRQGWKEVAWTSDIPTSLPANGGNADTVDGKHSSDFYLSGSNITNLPINGGIYWNPYVESGSDGSDAASITVIKDGNGTGGTVLEIKQANDSNDVVNVVAGDLRLNGTSVSTSGHDHDDRYYTESEINTKLNGKSDTGHTHSNYVTTDTEQTISGKKTFTNNVTVNALNTSYLSYSNSTTGLTITGPWGNNEQARLEFASGKIKGYNWYDDNIDSTSLSLQVELPAGANIDITSGGYRLTAPSAIYLKGNTNCYLQSTAKGWMVDGSDTYGCIYPAANHNGKIGLSANHFYQGYMNYIYANTIYPILYNGTSSATNTGSVGTTSNYFGSGAFRTVYRSSESGLSDIRSKQNISNNDLNALEIINNLNIINFQYDDDIKIEARNKKQRLKAINTMKELPKTKETKELRKELQKIIATPNNEDMITIGVSAQQLQELLPKKYQKTFIQKESTNQYADQLFIRENRLVYLSFKAIQEQQAIIGSLEEKINLLEEKINALEEKMKKEVN